MLGGSLNGFYKLLTRLAVVKTDSTNFYKPDNTLCGGQNSLFVPP